VARRVGGGAALIALHILGGDNRDRTRDLIDRGLSRGWADHDGLLLGRRTRWLRIGGRLLCGGYDAAGHGCPIGERGSGRVLLLSEGASTSMVGSRVWRSGLLRFGTRKPQREKQAQGKLEGKPAGYGAGAAALTMEDMVGPRYDVSGTSQRTKSHHRALRTPLVKLMSVLPDRHLRVVTTADGRSPGSRVDTFASPSQDRDSQWHMTKDSPLTVAGGSRGIGGSFPAPHSLLIPKQGKPSGIMVEVLSRSESIPSFGARNPDWTSAPFFAA